LIDRSASVVHSFNIGSIEKDASRKSISFPGKKAIHCVEEGSAFGIYLSNNSISDPLCFSQTFMENNEEETFFIGWLLK